MNKAQKILVLANPKAGGGRGYRRLDELKSVADTLPHSFTFESPDSASDTILSASQAPERGFDAVAALGGDGTACDVAEGLVDSGVALIHLPAGRGNDLIRNLDGPTDLEQAVRGLADYREVEIDVPLLNGRPFINVGGAGFDSVVLHHINHGRCFLGGTICYIWAVLKSIFSSHAPELTMSLDGNKIEGRYMMVAVANFHAYGGGMQIAPGADPSDGLLDFVFVRKMPVLAFLRKFPKVYAGTHLDEPEIELRRGRVLTMEGPGGFFASADGNLREPLPAHFEVGTHRLRVLVPASQ